MQEIPHTPIDHHTHPLTDPTLQQSPQKEIAPKMPTNYFQPPSADVFGN